MENPKSSMEEDRSPRTESFFAAKTREGVQLATTFTDSLTQYATPIDRHLPFSLVRIISLAQNLVIKTFIIFVRLGHILDSILSLFSGRDIPSSSDHPDPHKITPALEEPQSSVASESSSSPHSSAGTIDPDSAIPDSRVPLDVVGAGKTNPLTAGRPNQAAPRISVPPPNTNPSNATDRQQEAPIARLSSQSNQLSSLSDSANATFTRHEQGDGDAGLPEVAGLRHEAPNTQPHEHPGEPTPLPSSSAPQAESTRPFDPSPPSSQNQADPETAGFLRQLALASLKRYLEEETPDLLAESIQFSQQALDLQPPGDSNRAKALQLLAKAHLAGCTKNANDSSEAIALFKEILTLRPVGHPDRPRTMNNLGKALLMRYQRSRRETDLSDCLELVEELQSLSPADQPESKPSLQDRVTKILSECDRGFQSGWGPSIVALWEDDNTYSSTSSPDPMAALLKLGSTLFGSQERGGSGGRSGSGSGGPSDLWEEIEVPREAPTPQPQPPTRPNHSVKKISTTADRLQATLRWVDIAIEIDAKSELDAYRSAFTHLGSALAQGQSLQARQTVLLSEDIRNRPAKGLPLDAALWALAAAGPKLAVELLDQGRNLLLSSGGQFQTDLSDVRRQNSALADRFYRISRLLDSAILTGQGSSDRGSSHDGPIRHYKQISADWEAVVTKIRGLPGCESFLLPVPYIKLQEAAVDGPVIVILVDKDKSTAIIVTSDEEPHTVDLPNASEDALKKLHGEMEDARNNPAQAIHAMPSILSDLWAMLVQPIMQELKHTLHVPLGSRIWWCPTSWTSFLPLHAAGSYKKGGLNTQDLYISSYTPSLQTLRQSRDRLSSSSIRTESSLVISQAQAPGQPQLTGADDEAGVVFSLVPDAYLLSEEQGTKQGVLNGLRSNPWVHLACHGVSHPSDPFQSHFALHDGSLTIQDIIANDLPSGDFAYLSACHSAVQSRTLPDEDLTLAGGMQVAGFKSVVSTLWALADEDAPMVAEAFYKELVTKSGDGIPFDCKKTAEALHDAVKELREKKVPLFRWVNLVHHGI